MNDERVIKPIAHIYTDFKEKFGLPRQSGCVPSLKGRIVFLPEFRNSDALRGLEGYSHIWVIFDFSKAHFKGNEWSPTIRPPRLGGNTRVGVFASRSPFRPNSLGLSSLKLEGIEKTGAEGTVLCVSGVDILDNTPIYDIKPYLSYTDSHPEAMCGFADEVFNHSLKVEFSEKLSGIIPDNKLEALTECLSQDIRPGYKKEADKIYSMKFSEYDVKFKVLGDCVFVTDIEKLLF